MIYDWAIIFEYNNKHIAVMNHIIQETPVLGKLSYTKLKYFHNFVPLSFYGTTKYEWAHRHYNKHHTIYGPKTHLTKKTPHEQTNTHNLHTLYSIRKTLYIDSKFP